MMKGLIRKFITLLLWLVIGSAHQGWAQFNPSNPDEPMMKYRVILESNPADKAYLSGGGEYTQGTEVLIQQSSWNTSFEFSHWTLNGKFYTDSPSFVYTVERTDAKFVANYKFVPVNPAEPTVKYTRRLNLNCTPQGSCSFNYTSGSRVMVGDKIYLCAYGNTSYDFKGWYDGINLVSTEPRFYLTMPNKDLTLTAVYEFNPSNPADPSSFYSTSCEVNVKSSDEVKGKVSVDGLVNGRAVFGSTITLTATPIAGSPFFGWSDGESIISTDLSYSFMVTDEKSKLSFVGMFSVLLGDVDSNGKVDNADVSTLADYLLDKSPEKFNPLNADANQDKEFSVADIPAIVEIIKHQTKR